MFIWILMLCVIFAICAGAALYLMARVRRLSCLKNKKKTWARLISAAVVLLPAVALSFLWSPLNMVVCVLHLALFLLLAACPSSNNRIDSNVCSYYNWAERLKSLGTQLIFIGKWRYRRLDYRLAQANEPVKDAQRGEADFLTGTDGCATRRTACNSPVNPGTLPNGIPEIVVIY